MKIDPFDCNDMPFLKGLKPDDWSDVTPHFNFYLSSDFCFPVKAAAGNLVAGAGALIQHHTVAWLGHIMVRHDQRNKGIGRLITQGLVEMAYARGCSTVFLLATDLGAPVYEKVGFITETNYLFYKELTPDPSWRIPENIVSFSSEFEDQVAELDRYISGEDRFFHVQDHLPGSYIFLRNTRVEGVYLPGFGDGHILALTPEAGTGLMKLRLQTKDTASFPEDNTAATAFLAELGYQPFKQVKRMRLGEPKNWQPQGNYNRIGGNLG